MLNYTIKTHRSGTTYLQPHFFILNKGNNSGRPMNTSCPNCFVVLTDSSKNVDKLFYLVQSLQIGRFFHPYLKGSVIPFITIGDVKFIINKALKNYDTLRWDLKVEKLNQVLDYENNLLAQLEALNKLKLALLRV